MKKRAFSSFLVACGLVACGGATAVITELLTTFTEPAGRLSKVIVVSSVSVKLAPRIVTRVPPPGGPKAGVTPVITDDGAPPGGMITGLTERPVSRTSSTYQPSATIETSLDNRNRTRARA